MKKKKPLNKKEFNILVRESFQQVAELYPYLRIRLPKNKFDLKSVYVPTITELLRHERSELILEIANKEKRLIQVESLLKHFKRKTTKAQRK